MKERIIPALKFIGLHIMVGSTYILLFLFVDTLEYDFGITFFNSIYEMLELKFGNIHIFEWVVISIMDTMLTLAIIDKFSIFKGKFRIIKTWGAWVVGVIIAYYSCVFITMIYWLM